MEQEALADAKKAKEEDEPELPLHWQKVQGAIWMIGIAILAITGWWWPGIMLVVAASALAEAGIRFYLSRQEEKVTSVAADEALAEKRVALLPEQCPGCGSPATIENARWVGPLSAKCAFCGSSLTGKE